MLDAVRILCRVRMNGTHLAVPSLYWIEVRAAKTSEHTYLRYGCPCSNKVQIYSLHSWKYTKAAYSHTTNVHVSYQKQINQCLPNTTFLFFICNHCNYNPQPSQKKSTQITSYHDPLRQNISAWDLYGKKCTTCKFVSETHWYTWSSIQRAL